MKPIKPVAIQTGELYSSIWDTFDQKEWERFSDDHIFKWSSLPLEEGFFNRKVCLDAGCGSGRFTRNLLLHGVQKVCAIDVGEGCVRNTQKRNATFAEKLEVKSASVLEIPYEDATFDFVHCDGVLHHTTDPEKGFTELVRVLKPGGTMVVGVYGKGGLMNFAIYTARLFRFIIPQRLTLSVLKKIIADPVIWYAVIDPMYVPIRKNYHEAEIRNWFESAYLINIKRLDSNWGPYTKGKWMKGEGYIKFIAEKKVSI